jgi:heme/copper-type cytochrome/quinol oxidase subunit 4
MDSADIRKRTRTHLIAFAAILVLALAAASTAFLGATSPAAVLGIAAIQAGVVLTAMMHARAEGPWVRGVLVFAAFFVAAMLGLFSLGKRSTIEGTQVLTATPAVAQEEAH